MAWQKLEMLKTMNIIHCRRLKFLNISNMLPLLGRPAPAKGKFVLATVDCCQIIIRSGAWFRFPNPLLLTD